MRDDDSSRSSIQQREAMAVLGVLRAACATGCHASLLPVHKLLSWTGRLRSASLDGVVVEIPNPPADAELQGASVSVSFRTGQNVRAFVSEVVDVDETNDGELLATLRLPQRLQDGDRRAAVRIPVPRGTIVARLVRGDARHHVRPIDISLQGILLELDEAEVERVGIGESVKVLLAHGDIKLAIEATVRRRDGLRLGFRFTTGSDPPKRLTKIIYMLQSERRPRR